jgi:radical SAM protein with 4Fe4S-binding SPASM domain
MEEMPPIKGFWLVPSYKCNNRCVWCYVGGKLEEQSEVSLSDAKKYLTTMANLGAKTCVLIGGEPSIYQHIIKVIKFANRLKIKVKMVTNGRKLSSPKFVRQLKDAGLISCSVSIEGTEKIHDNITRVAGSFAESVTGITNCLDEGLPINTITTVSQLNKDVLVDLIEQMRSIGVKVSAFNMCSSQPSGYGADVGIINLSEYARIVEDIGLKYDSARFYGLIPLCLYDETKLIKLLELGRMKVSCSLLSNSITIDPQGDILPCTHMANLTYGNLNVKEDVQTIRELKQREKKFLSSHAPSEKCINCKWWTTCLGGCSLIWFSRKAEDFITGKEI